MAYHKSLGVSVDPTAFAPRFPDTGLHEPDSEVPEIGFDLERSMWCHIITFSAVRNHHGVHESYEVLCRFCLKHEVSRDLEMTSKYTPCRPRSRTFCSG